MSGEARCGYPFDGQGKVLAHAFFPEDGRAHFDEDETFTDGTSSGTNLLWVATHEFGHALGIEHSDVRDAIMYPYYTGYVAGMQLHSDDIAAIRSLYGNVTFVFLYHCFNCKLLIGQICPGLHVVAKICYIILSTMFIFYLFAVEG